MGPSQQNAGSSHTTSTPWAPAQPYITDVMGQAQHLANNGRDYNVGGLMGIANDVIGGKYLHPEQNQYIQGMIPQLQKEMMHGVNMTRDASQANGAFGGDRMQLAQGAAAGAMEDSMARIYMDQYNRERSNQMNVGQLLGQAQGLDWGPLMNYSNIVSQQSAPYATRDTTGTQPGPSGLTQGLSTALGIGQLLSLFS